MQARDIVGKTVARLSHERVYDESIGRHAWSVRAIWFTDGSHIVFTAHDDGYDTFVQAHYHPQKETP